MQYYTSGICLVQHMAASCSAPWIEGGKNSPRENILTGRERTRSLIFLYKIPALAFREHLAVHGQLGYLHAAAVSLPRGSAPRPPTQELPSCHQQHGGQVKIHFDWIVFPFFTWWVLLICVGWSFLVSALFVYALNRFAIATAEELAANDDDCAICWDAMLTARRLPCGHLFHK